jgi:peptide chain release factor
MIRLLLTSGRGPGECRLALAKTLAAMAREAEAAGVELATAAGADPDGQGPASAIALVDGAGAELFAAGWVGSILWVCRSPLRPHHKRKNWFVGVSRLEADTPKAVVLAPSDMRFEALQAGGPGGQHQNKTQSAVRAVHTPTGLTVVVREGRSQHRNKAIATERLRALLELASEVAASADSHSIQVRHDRLERGRPVRTFVGEEFRPRRGAARP